MNNMNLRPASKTNYFH